MAGLRKKVVATLASLVATCVLAMGFAQVAFATNITYNVLDYGAKANDSNDDAAAINAALREARLIGAGTSVTVNVPAGAYHIKTPLRIYSDTTLHLDAKARIIADYDNEEMITGFHVNPKSPSDNCQGSTCTHGGYTQLKNITLEGGSWERKSYKKSDKVGAACILRLRHGHNITLRNMTCKGSAAHFFNVSATNHTVIENVKFIDAQQVTDKSSSFWREDGSKWGNMDTYNGVEAIHLDTTDGIGEGGAGAMPLDNTPCKDITVRNCTFDNVWAGVGNHHPAKSQKKRSSDIKVVGCTFNNIRHYAFKALDFDNVTFQNNKVTNANGIAELQGCTGVSIGGVTFKRGGKSAGKFVASTKVPPIKAKSMKGLRVENCSISNAPHNGIRVEDSTGVVVKGTTVTNAKQKGIFISGSGANIQKNSVTNSKDVGIRVTGGKVTVKGNVVSQAGYNGIQVDAKAKVTIDSNVVKSSKLHGIVVQLCNNAAIQGNKVSASKGRGISLQSCKGAKVLKNNVSKVKREALYLIGTKKKPCQAKIANNKLASSKSYDMKLSSYSKKCKISGNKYGHNNINIHRTATYIGKLPTK